MRNKIIGNGFFFLAVCLPLATKLYAQQAAPDTVNLSPDSARGKVVNLVYYTVPRYLTTTSTDAVYNKDLMKSPVTSPFSALVGRLSGINTFQSSGQPLFDAAAVTLHGRTPIVLIDGVVRNLSTIDLEEIESITVLKDAVSTAMLGLRGANGALSIQTKKGTSGKQVISFTAQTGTQQGLGLPRALSAYDYARLKNEAIDNELRVNPTFNGVKYSDADLLSWQSGGDSLHPNVDWESQLFKKTSTINRYTLSVTGGNSFSRYFVSLEHLNQAGFLKTIDANKYSTNNSIQSYLARTNIDVNLTSKLSAGVSLVGRILSTNEPGGNVNDNNAGNGINDIYSGLFATPNNAYPAFNPNGSYYGNANFTANLQAQATGTGYNRGYIRDILTDIFLKRTLDDLVPGLWVKAKLSYSSNVSEKLTRTKNLISFKPAGSAYTQFGNTVLQRNTNAILQQGRSNYMEFSAGYSHLINAKHGLDVLVLANRDNTTLTTTNNNEFLPYTVSGISGKLSYNYQRKYIIEGAFAYNGSNRYPDGDNKTRYGFFPSVGAAWNISSEACMQSLRWLNALKLYGSFGKTGWDNPGYFVYLQRYNNNANVFFGSGATPTTTLIQGTLANTGITWEKAAKTTFGLQGSFFNNHLGLTAEYYHNKYTDLLQQRGRTTGILGATYPAENIGRNLYTGFDFILSWQGSAKAFAYYISANATVQSSEVLFADEVDQPYDYLQRTGNTVGRAFGYVADGLFGSQAEINSAPTFLGYTPQPGDIRYKDLNKDGFINQLDQTAIGTTKPFIAYGVSLGISVKGFDVSALLQGVANRDQYLPSNASAFFEFQNGGLGQAYENSLDRWTPTNAGASYPRLSIGNNTNNQVFSSYWLRDGKYLRLKNAEIGYTFPVKLTARDKMTAIRLFANGVNLITWTPLKGGRDPEVFGTYPIQRVINFGINIKL